VDDWDFDDVLREEWSSVVDKAAAHADHVWSGGDALALGLAFVMALERAQLPETQGRAVMAELFRMWAHCSKE
jgi:hypothetical protein